MSPIPKQIAALFCLIVRNTRLILRFLAGRSAFWTSNGVDVETSTQPALLVALSFILICGISSPQFHQRIALAQPQATQSFLDASQKQTAQTLAQNKALQEPNPDTLQVLSRNNNSKAMYEFRLKNLSTEESLYQVEHNQQLRALLKTILYNAHPWDAGSYMQSFKLSETDFKHFTQSALNLVGCAWSQGISSKAFANALADKSPAEAQALHEALENKQNLADLQASLELFVTEAFNLSQAEANKNTQDNKNAPHRAFETTLQNKEPHMKLPNADLILRTNVIKEQHNNAKGNTQEEASLFISLEPRHASSTSTFRAAVGYPLIFMVKNKEQELLSNALLSLYKLEGAREIKIASWETQDYGTTEVKHLDPGLYSVRQDQAPAGFEHMEEIRFQIKPDGSVTSSDQALVGKTQVGGQELTSISFIDPFKQGTINIKVLNEQGEPVKGATMEIYLVNNNRHELILQHRFSIENGPVTLSLSSMNQYLLHMTSPNIGYQFPADALFLMDSTPRIPFWGNSLGANTKLTGTMNPDDFSYDELTVRLKKAPLLYTQDTLPKLSLEGFTVQTKQGLPLKLEGSDVATPLNVRIQAQAQLFGNLDYKARFQLVDITDPSNPSIDGLPALETALQWENNAKLKVSTYTRSILGHPYTLERFEGPFNKAAPLEGIVLQNQKLQAGHTYKLTAQISSLQSLSLQEARLDSSQGKLVATGPIEAAKPITLSFNPNATRVEAEGLYIKVASNPDPVELPNTGGVGSLLYSLAGIFCMLLAGILYIRKRSRA